MNTTQLSTNPQTLSLPREPKQRGGFWRLANISVNYVLQLSFIKVITKSPRGKATPFAFVHEGKRHGVCKTGILICIL
jgi:hypothetical protein